MRSEFQRISDEWLVLRAQGGDEKALALLVARNQGLVLRHAMRLTRDPDAAADVAQETWLAVVKRLHRLRDPRAFHAFALRIAGNKAADWTRGKVRRRRAWPGLHARAAQLAAPPDASAPEGALAVRTALDNLSHDHAVVVALHYAEGLGLGEIAAALDIPLGTVKSRLHHARERLRAALPERIES